MKETRTIHSNLVGRKVRIEGDFADGGPQQRYFKRKGQVGEIVNVYLKGEDPTYDVLFSDGRMETMYDFAFTFLARSREIM